MVRSRRQNDKRRNATIRMCGLRNAISNKQVRFFNLVDFFFLNFLFFYWHMCLLLLLVKTKKEITVNCNRERSNVYFVKMDPFNSQHSFLPPYISRNEDMAYEVLVSSTTLEVSIICTHSYNPHNKWKHRKEIVLHYWV